jgi:aarF domain-containing kinase
MRPLQDKCDPTPYEDVEALFLSEMGKPIGELFEDFDPVPIGVASLAQVHVGKHRGSDKKVAVKVSLASRSASRSACVLCLCWNS